MHARGGHKVHIYEIAKRNDSNMWPRYALCRRVQSIVYAGEPLTWKTAAKIGARLTRENGYNVCEHCESIAARHPAEDGVLT